MPAEYKTGSVRASTLEKETRIVIEEARMVLPGIQALFGFQLIAIFNNRFQSFSRGEQSFHLLALLLVAIAVALINDAGGVPSNWAKGHIVAPFY